MNPKRDEEVAELEEARRVYHINHNDGRKAARRYKSEDEFEPRKYSKADEEFAKRLRAGFRMMRGSR